MTAPDAYDFALLNPTVPTVSSAYDIANYVTVDTPDVNCARNI
jgi:hypothetical protein